MSEDQLRRVFGEGEPDWLEEHSMTGLDSQQVVGSLDTQAFFELLKLPYPTERAGVIERLLDERLIDEAGGSYAVRRLCALLLANRLDEFPDLARKAPRVVVYTGTSKLARDPAGPDSRTGLRRWLSGAGPLHHGSVAAE